MPLVNLAHARYLDNIDPNSDVDAPRWTERSRQACHPRGPKEPVGYRHARLPHQGRKQQRQVLLLHPLALSISRGRPLWSPNRHQPKIQAQDSVGARAVGGGWEGLDGRPRPVPWAPILEEHDPISTPRRP